MNLPGLSGSPPDFPSAEAHAFQTACVAIPDLKGLFMAATAARIETPYLNRFAGSSCLVAEFHRAFSGLLHAKIREPAGPHLSGVLAAAVLPADSHLYITTNVYFWIEKPSGFKVPPASRAVGLRVPQRVELKVHPPDLPVAKPFNFRWLRLANFVPMAPA